MKQHNLEGMTADQMVWEMKDGIHSEAKDKGDSFLAQSEGKILFISTDDLTVGGCSVLISRW